MQDLETVQEKPVTPTGEKGPAASSMLSDNEAEPKVDDSSLETEIQIPDEVSVLLEPISSDTATGQDATTEEEYFRLDMEIGKVKPDYGACIEWATVILKEKSKDLRVAAWLCFAWFRNEKIAGLKHGLILLTGLLKNFGEQLYPENIKHRAQAIQFLNSGRFFKLLEREEINKDNAEDAAEIGTIFEQLTVGCQTHFADSSPVFKDISRVIATHAETAKQFMVKETPKKAEVSTEVLKDKESEDRTSVPETTIEQPKAAPSTAAVTTEEIRVKNISLASDKDGLVAFKRIVRYFFEDESDGQKKLPTDPSIYGISRLLQWGKLIMPPNKDEITQIEGPNSIMQNKLQELFSSNNWDELIPRIEINFLNEDSGFKYWLDAQMYVTKALEQKGGVTAKAAEEIKFHLARLIMRFPALPKLVFKNKIPFANKDTSKWLEDEVKAVVGGGKSEDQIMPPIMGEDYKPINQEYEAACAELPENFEKNVATMQHGIAGDTRRKGRFLRSLNLANFCIKAKQNSLAKVHLSHLLEKIDEYNLSEWEPALCVAVWQSTYLVNIKLLESELYRDQKSLLEKQQKELFTKIGNYDGVLAIKLANRNSKGGE